MKLRSVSKRELIWKVNIMLSVSVIVFYSLTILSSTTLKVHKPYDEIDPFIS